MLLFPTILVFPKELMSLSKNTQYVLQKCLVCVAALHILVSAEHKRVLDDATGCEFDTLSVWEASDNAC